MTDEKDREIDSIATIDRKPWQQYHDTIAALHPAQRLGVEIDHRSIVLALFSSMHTSGAMHILGGILAAQKLKDFYKCQGISSH